MEIQYIIHKIIDIMNIVGIDPSLISTGLVVNGNVVLFTRESDVYGKKGLRKWFKLGEQHIDYEFINHRPKTGNYQRDEIIKMVDYDTITTDIVKKIKSLIDPDEDTVIGIESYSYASAVGDIIDLVTFSTTLRIKLYNEITNNIFIIPPKSLKFEAGKLTYPEEKKGKKITYRNHYGIASGLFQKREMYFSLIDNKTFVENDRFVKHLKSIQEEILTPAKINKPYDDTNDAYIIYKHLDHLNNEGVLFDYYKLIH